MKKSKTFEQQGDPAVVALTPQAAQRAAQEGMNADPASKHLFLHMPTVHHHRAIVETDTKEHYITADGAIAVEAKRPPLVPF